VYVAFLTYRSTNVPSNGSLGNDLSRFSIQMPEFKRHPAGRVEKRFGKTGRRERGSKTEAETKMLFAMGLTYDDCLCCCLAFHDLTHPPLFIRRDRSELQRFPEGSRSGSGGATSHGRRQIRFNLRNESTGKTGLRNACVWMSRKS
jgi:hypothetical protein